MSDTFPYHSYTWLPHDGARHAYPGEKQPDGQAVTTYCRLAATATTYDNPRAPERLWPECPTCKTLVDQVADRRAAAAAQVRYDLHAYGDRPPCRHHHHT